MRYSHEKQFLYTEIVVGKYTYLQRVSQSSTVGYRWSAYEFLVAPTAEFSSENLHRVYLFHFNGTSHDALKFVSIFSFAHASHVSIVDPNAHHKTDPCGAKWRQGSMSATVPILIQLIL